METILDWTSFVVIILAGIYLIGLGIISLAQPGKASAFLSGFAGSAKLHYIELTIRIIVGTAFLWHAPKTLAPFVFTVLGAVLVATTAVLLCIPWKIHRRFAEKSVPQALRYLPLIGIASLLFGLTLIAMMI